MSNHPISLKPFGDQAILIEWPPKVEESILYDILVFSEYLKSECLERKDWELVPAYNSLTLIHHQKIDSPSNLIEQLKSWYSNVERSWVSFGGSAMPVF